MLTKQEKTEKIKKLRLIDDAFIEALSDNEEAFEEILRIFLEDEGLKVSEVYVEGSRADMYGRGLAIEVVCTLGDGTPYYIEIQRENGDDHCRRTRFGGAALTLKDAAPGARFESVKNVLVIYISENDVFKSGRTMYHVEKRINETEEEYEDGFDEIFINTAINDGTEIGELMAALTKRELTDRRFPKLSAAAQKLKNSEDGLDALFSIIDGYANAGEAEAVYAGGSYEPAYQVAGASDEEIAEAKAEAREAGRAEGFEEGREVGRAEGREEGRAEGRAEGREEGRAEGLEEGRAEAREESRAEGVQEDRAEIIEQGRVEGREEGRLKGIEEHKIKMFVKCLDCGMTYEDAQSFSEIDEETAQRVMNERQG